MRRIEASQDLRGGESPLGISTRFTVGLALSASLRRVLRRVSDSFSPFYTFWQKVRNMRISLFYTFWQKVRNRTGYMPNIPRLRTVSSRLKLVASLSLSTFGTGPPNKTNSETGERKPNSEAGESDGKRFTTNCLFGNTSP